ncbi:SbmA/BacA-like family transporter [Verrucomicrobium sp. BvORR106]|uniref:ABC transporter ATP-binding protein/permease n=1 Tax=Verrucomicrobium sp. BvORR106 TaxID=1403819 RepID=UPI00068A607B|nr:SbmA/BacA-like family transporter [Verrucomicrobium sp. BvORR106]
MPSPPIKEEKHPKLKPQTFQRMKRSIGVFLSSPAGGRAKMLLFMLLACMFCINGMNVLNSYVGRYFMSAIEKRDMAAFVHYAWLYVAVFGGSTVVAVFYRFAEERLGLLWRDWLTHRIVGLYVDQRLYLRFEESGALTNPDQRMSEDVKQLTVSTLSFLLLILNGTMTAISFSGVLWSISPKLFLVAVVYAAVGSALTIWLGRPLIRLNYQQADREADFRSELIRMRENAEGIAVTGNQQTIRHRLMTRIDQLVGNFRRITEINRNLNFFTTGYNYMIQLIPSLIVAPLFIQGKVEFGVIGQSAMAFATLLAAFSLIIAQFQAISSYASVITRLGEFVEATECAGLDCDAPQVEYATGSDRFLYAGLTLRTSSKDHTVIVSDLNLTLTPGLRVLVNGPSQTARVALFRTSAGVQVEGIGSIVRPPVEKLAFLPGQPYLPPGSVREIVIPAGCEERVSNEALWQLFDEIGLKSSKLKSDEDLTTPHNWEDRLSISKQHLLSIARALLSDPEYIFLDHIESALGENHAEMALSALRARGITCVSFEESEPDPARHDAVLELHDDGSWKWIELRSNGPRMIS